MLSVLHDLISWFFQRSIFGNRKISIWFAFNLKTQYPSSLGSFIGRFELKCAGYSALLDLNEGYENRIILIWYWITFQTICCHKSIKCNYSSIPKIGIHKRFQIFFATRERKIFLDLLFSYSSIAQALWIYKFTNVKKKIFQYLFLIARNKLNKINNYHESFRDDIR